MSHILSSIALLFTSHLCKDPFPSFSEWHHLILAILLQVRQYLLAFQWPRYLEAVMSGWGHPVRMEILVSRKSYPPSNQHPITIECSPLQGCEEERWSTLSCHLPTTETRLTATHLGRGHNPLHGDNMVFLWFVKFNFNFVEWSPTGLTYESIQYRKERQIEHKLLLAPLFAGVILAYCGNPFQSTIQSTRIIL